MAKNNNTLIFIIVLGLLVFFAVYCVWGKKHNYESESYSSTKNIRKESEGNDFEYIQKADSIVGGDQDSFELLGVAPEEPAYQIGFGMGPGLYGSGRHTSEMVGN